MIKHNMNIRKEFTNIIFKSPRNSHRPSGATLSLAIVLAMLVVIIGVGLFYMMEFFGGSKQLDNATDAGTLAAARQIMAISLTPDQINHTDGKGNLDVISQHFKFYCVDSNNNFPTGLITDAQGNSTPLFDNQGTPSNPPTPTFYNIVSYNMCCMYTLYTCLNAANHNNPAEIANANNLVACLNNFANYLSQDIANTAQLPGSTIPAAFASITEQNPTNILPSWLPKSLNGGFPWNNTKAMGPQVTMVPNTMHFARDTSYKVSNCYFPASITNNWTPGELELISSNTTNSASGQTLIKAGLPINLKDISAALVGSITLVPLGQENTHLVSSQTFAEYYNNSTYNVVMFSLAGIMFNGTGDGTLIVTGDGNYYLAPPPGEPHWTNHGDYLISTSSWNPIFVFSGGMTGAFSASGWGTGAFAGDLQLNPEPWAGANNFSNYGGATLSFPYNTVQAQGQVERTNGANSLAVISSAIADQLKQYPFKLPANGYIRIVNGPDFVQAMNNSVGTAATLESEGFSNIELEPGGPGSSINLAYNGVLNPTGIFDLWDWTDQSSGGSSDYVVVATDSSSGVLGGFFGSVLKDIEKDNTIAFSWTDGFANASAYESSAPQLNSNGYNGLVDNAAFNQGRTSPLDTGQNTTGDPNAAVVPFIWSCMEPGGTATSLNWPIVVFGPWAVYNSSHGNDPQGHNPKLDPLQYFYRHSSAGNPYDAAGNYFGEATVYGGHDVAHFINKHGKGYQLQEGRASGGLQQRMTLADALQIRDIYVLNDGAHSFNPDLQQPAWVNQVVPVCAFNYNHSYLPQDLGGTKKSFTATEYAKAQLVGIFGGAGLPNVPPSDPNRKLGIFLPYLAGHNVVGGMKDFIGPPGGAVFSASSGSWPNLPNPANQVYEHSGNLVHRAWRSASDVQNFEVAASPMQQLYDIVVLGNNGVFTTAGNNRNYIPNSTFVNIMNGILNIAQQWNPACTMQDVINVLSSLPIDSPGQTFDCGQTWYLSYNAGNAANNGLQITITLPQGDAGGASDGNAITTYQCNYPITGGWVDENAEAKARKNGHFEEYVAPRRDKKSLVDTGANTATSHDSDCSMHDAIYRGIEDATHRGQDLPIYANDLVLWNPASGAITGSVNLGDLTIGETAGPTMWVGSVN